MEYWFVAKTKPKKERYVETFLSEKWDIEVFSPYIRKPMARQTCFEPLFPTYLFCRFDTDSAAWPAIRWIPGLCYFLGSGEQLIPVTGELISQIKHQVSLWNMGEHKPCFSTGDRVKFTGSLLAGIEGVFQKYLPSRKRCQVLLSIIGQPNKVELPIESLRTEYHYKKLILST